MKKVAFIVVLFFCSFGWAQNFVLVDKLPEENDVVYNEKEYKELLQYTPKSFVQNIQSRPQNRVLLGDLNSISALEIRYAYQQQIHLNAAEIKWLEEEISQLATAFYKEGKPMIIKRAGNYDQCTGQGTEKKQENGISFTNLYLCFTYPQGLIYENRFLEIFNGRMQKLTTEKTKK